MNPYTRLPIRPSDQDQFEGREGDLACLLTQLSKPGLSAAIFGERGIGKTSLALQLSAALQGQTQKYKDSISGFGANREYKCVSVKDLKALDNTRDLIISAISKSARQYSLSNLAPKLFEDDKFKDYIKMTYGVDFSDVQQLSIFGKLQDNDDVISKLFDDIIAQLAILYPNCEFIFFVDEIDKMKNKNGLGEFIKNANDARFLLVGIGDTFEDIVEDHPSSFRRMTNGIVDLGPMKPFEIRKILTVPIAREDASMTYSTGFLEKAVKYCAGIPWLAQVVGELSVDHAEQVRKRQKLASSLIVRESVFRDIWGGVRSEWTRAFGQNADFEVLKRKANRVAVRSLIRSGRYLSVDEIDKYIHENGEPGEEKPLFTTLHACVADLAGAGILIERPDGKYRFINPIVRSFALERIEDLDGKSVEVDE